MLPHLSNSLLTALKMPTNYCSSTAIWVGVYVCYGDTAGEENLPAPEAQAQAGLYQQLLSGHAVTASAGGAMVEGRAGRGEIRRL